MLTIFNFAHERFLSDCMVDAALAAALRVPQINLNRPNIIHIILYNKYIMRTILNTRDSHSARHHKSAH